MTSPTVSVVIPTRGRAALLERSLQTVLSDLATTEVVVVLDGSDAETVALLGGLAERDPRVRFARIEHDPLGLERGGRAREEGVRLAGSEVVLALDDDVVPRPGLVSGHAARHAAEDDPVVVLGAMPVVKPTNGSADATAQIYGASYDRACREYESNPNAILERLWGGNLSIRRRDWLKALALPRVGAGYHADLELGLLLRRAGLRGVFDPRLQADHFYQRSRRDFAGDAESSGAGLASLLTEHPSLRGSEPEARFVLRIFLAIAVRRRGWPFLRECLLATAAVASAIRIPWVETHALLLLWQAGVARGSRTAGCVRLPHAAGTIEAVSAGARLLCDR